MQGMCSYQQWAGGVAVLPESPALDKYECDARVFGGSWKVCEGSMGGCSRSVIAVRRDWCKGRASSWVRFVWFCAWFIMHGAVSFVCLQGLLTAAKLQWTGMGVHGEVFQVHGTLCSYCKPGEIHRHGQWIREKQHKYKRACGKSTDSMATVLEGGLEELRRNDNAEHVVRCIFFFFPPSNVTALLFPKPTERLQFPELWVSISWQLGEKQHVRPPVTH